MAAVDDALSIAGIDRSPSTLAAVGDLVVPFRDRRRDTAIPRYRDTAIP
ncbi:hypothetical protein ACN9MI_22650 [Rhodococcoides fascians]|nr:hypothetical protein [Rhodococcus fascians]WQH28001.1 hypothetical protein U2G91_23600 [Rhodococcus fascians]